MLNLLRIGAVMRKLNHFGKVSVLEQAPFFL